MSKVTKAEQLMKEKVEEWKEAKAELDRFKRLEMKLRKELFAEVFPTPKEGTNKTELAGFAFKGVHKLNYTLEEALVPNVRSALQKLNVNPDTIFKVKVNLIKKGFENLTGQAKEILEEAVTVKAGSPTLTIVEIEE